MGLYREWEFHGLNKDGSNLSYEQIDRLINMDEYDLFDMTCYDDDSLFGFGHTESFGAYERIFNAVQRHAFLYPEINMTVIVRKEPDAMDEGWIVRDGKIQTFTSKRIYLDEQGNEIDPFEGV